MIYFSPICKHKLRAIKRLKTVKMSTNGLTVSKVLEQIQLVQGMIDINASSLNSLRTQFSTNSDLIQQEIRTLEVNLLNFTIMFRVFGDLLEEVHFTAVDRQIENNKIGVRRTF